MSYESIRITTRFSETDALGHISNISYFVYFEEARIHFIHQLSPNMNARNWTFILASTKCDFVNQAFFAQKLVVNTTVKRIGNKSFNLLHQLVDEQTKQLIAKTEEAIVHFNFETQKSEPIPDEMRAYMERYLDHSST